jgi:hypothetical protein
MHCWTVPPSDACGTFSGRTPARSRGLDGPVRGDGPGTQASDAIEIQSFLELRVSGNPALRRTSGGTRHGLTPRHWDISVSAAVYTPSRRPSLTDWNICAILCSSIEGHATHSQRPGPQTPASPAGPSAADGALSHPHTVWTLPSASSGRCRKTCSERALEVPVPSPRGANPDVESKKLRRQVPVHTRLPLGGETAGSARSQQRLSQPRRPSLLHNNGARRLSSKMYAQSVAAVACAHSSAML